MSELLARQQASYRNELMFKRFLHGCLLTDYCDGDVEVSSCM